MIRERGRPKRKRLFQYKIYLTAKQIRWLKSKKSYPISSASSLFRALLENYMHWRLDHLKAKLLDCQSAEKKQKLEDEIKILEEYLEI